MRFSRQLRFVVLILVACATVLPVAAAEVTTGMKQHAGLFDLWWSEEKGKVFMAIDQLNREYLYLVSLPNGVGSNDIGLDRGQLGTEYVVEFRRIGPKVLMVAKNTSYRAESSNPAEKKAVTEAFATSVLARFDVQGTQGGKTLVDITPLLLSDAYGVSQQLSDSGQGSFSFDEKLSAPEPSTLKSFPKNSLAEAWLTFTSGSPGPEVASVTPNPKKITVKVRHHFVELPAKPLARREYNPQSGYFSVPYRDYAAALDEPIEQHLLVRHRLEKKDPSQLQGEAVEPLIYYVDPGAPEPIRSALITGASWWNQAFEAAGFINAFQVKLLPMDADPLDLRYNVIQWVHRSTRGWSYGASIVDPRSGEILKGHVSLGSLRVRQDMLIAQALTAPFGPEGDQGKAAENMAIARLKQLSAHEVGHTLGLAHNFFTSAKNDASVMDYPHPNLELTGDGKISLANAYDSDIGEWDKLAITYGYAVYPDGKMEAEGLRKTLAEADELGLRFITDADVRGPATAHAAAHLWDNGPDVLKQFDKLMSIRRVGLTNFSKQVLRPGQAMGELEQALVPLYLLHRYQAEAVTKLIAGVDYDYALNGEPNADVTVVPAATQSQALDALLASLSKDNLALSDELIHQLLPPAFGYERNREYFTPLTSNDFDQLAPARAATQLITEMLLEPMRAQRLWQQTQYDADQLSLQQALTRVSEALVLPINSSNQTSDQITETVAWVTVRQLQRLAVDPNASDPVHALVLAQLSKLSGQLKRGEQAKSMAETLKQFLQNPAPDAIPSKITVPPGSPI